MGTSSSSPPSTTTTAPPKAKTLTERDAPALTPRQMLLVCVASGLEIRTVRGVLAGRGRIASARKVEAALAALGFEVRKL